MTTNNKTRYKKFRVVATGWKFSQTGRAEDFFGKTVFANFRPFQF